MSTARRLRKLTKTILSCPLSRFFSSLVFDTVAHSALSAWQTKGYEREARGAAISSAAHCSGVAWAVRERASTSSDVCPHSVWRV